MNVRSVLAATISLQVARGVVSLIAGRAPPPQRGLSFTTRYVLVDLAFLLVMLILIWASYSLWQDYKDPNRGPQDAKSIMQVRFFTLAGPMFIPLATIVAVPLIFEVRLRGILTNEPGLTYASLILSAAQIVYGVLRITLTFREPGMERTSA